MIDYKEYELAFPIDLESEYTEYMLNTQDKHQEIFKKISQWLLNN